MALGAADAFAFFVRPNVGAILLALSVLAMLPRRARAVTALLGGFLVVALPWGLATQGRRSGWRGLDYALAIGGHDYAWALSGGEVPPAGEGWSATLRESGADLRRQLFWRGLHGLLGIEFYDARWSPAYRGLDEAARAASPFVTLLSIAVLSTAKRREPSRRLGLSLLALIVLQSVAIGALPRYALPLLPALFLLALAAAASNDAAAPSRLWPALVVFGLLVAFTRWQHQVVDREGGILESPGARLTQPIPRAALPSRTPATLHIRIGAPLLPTGAGVAIRGPGGATLYETLPGSERREPFLTVPLPASVLERNRNEPVVLTLEATGSYDANHYLFFPVIPPPWSAPARREGSTELSPVSGVVRGGLDWWAHEGER